LLNHCSRTLWHNYKIPLYFNQLLKSLANQLLKKVEQKIICLYFAGICLYFRIYFAPLFLKVEKVEKVKKKLKQKFKYFYINTKKIK
jgi:hypothetical protein